MADVKVQAVVEASTEGVERAFDRVGDKAAQMASKVDQAAQKAGGSVDSIGSGAGTSADQLTRAEGRMVASIKRVQTQMELAGKTASQKFEFNIAAKGLDAAKFEPMLVKMREIEAQQARIATGASGLTGQMSGLAVAVGAAGAAFAAWSSLKGIASSMIDAQQSAQKLKNSIEYAAGGATQAASEISYLREVTIKLGLDFDSSSQAYAKFAAATKGSGVSLQQTKTVFEGIASASAKMVLSADETQGALLALSQMASKGTVSAEELRGQLGERLPGAFNIAAKSMGVTTAELGKLLETGQLMASDFLPKFGQALKDNFQAPLDSLTQELNRFSSAWTLWKQTLSDGANGSGFKWLTNGLNESTEAMRALGKEAGIVQRLLVAIGGFELGAVGANKFDAAKLQEQELKNLEAIKARKARLEAAITSGATTRSSSQAGFDALAKEERAIRERLINLAEQRGKKDGLNLPDLAGEYLAQQTKQNEKLKAYINDVSNAPKAAKVAAEVEKENTAFKAAVSGMAETDSRYISALKAHNDRVAEIQKSAKATGGGSAKNDATQQYAAALAAEKDFSAAQVKLIQNRVSAGVESEEAGIKKVLAAKIAGYDKEREILNAQLAKTSDNGDKSKIEQQIAAIGTASTVAAAEAEAAFAKINQAREKYLQAQVTSANSIAYRIEDENEALREQIDVLGMSEQQIGEYESAKINAAAGAEYLAAANLREAASSMEAAGVASDAIPYYRQLADAREAAGNALSEKAALESTKGIKKSAIEAAKEWQKTSDKIGDSITDALMRGFESGKGFAETLRDTVVNMFKTMVLQPTIKAVVVGGLSAVGMGGATAADGTSAGGIGNMLSTGKSIYSTGSSVYDVGSQWLGGTMSGANAAGTLYANATGTGLDGLLATNGAYGTAAGTAAAADLGATIGTAAGTALAGSSAGTVFATTMTGAAVNTTTMAGVALASGTAPVVGGAAAGSGAMAAIPVVGWVAAAAAAAYAIFGHEKHDPTEGVEVTSTNAGNGSNYITKVGDIRNDGYAYNEVLMSNAAAINKQYLDTLNPFLAAMGNTQTVSIATHQIKKDNQKKSTGFDVSVGDASSHLAYGYGKDVSDADALAQSTASAMGEAMSRAITMLDIAEPIRRLFNGVTDPTLVQNMMTGITKVGNASKELNDVWGISVSQAAEVALMTGQTQEGMAKTVDAIGTFAAAQRSVGTSLESAYTAMSPIFKALTNSALPDSLAAYDAAMKSVDTTVAGGIETFAALFAMREGFAQFQAAVDAMKKSVGDSVYDLRTTAEKSAIQQKTLADAAKAAGVAVPKTAAELVKMADSIDYTTKAGFDLAAAMPALVAAFKAVDVASQAAATAAAEQATAIRAEKQARAEAAQSTLDDFKSGYASLQTEALNNARGTTGGRVGGLAFSGTEYDSVSNFVTYLDDANATLAEMASSPFAEELAGYTAEIKALAKSVSDQTANSLYESRLKSGDVAGALAAELSKNPLKYSDFNTTTRIGPKPDRSDFATRGDFDAAFSKWDSKQFNSGAFNLALEKASIEAMVKIGNYTSANALSIKNTNGGFSGESASEAFKYSIRSDIAKDYGFVVQSSLGDVLSGALDVAVRNVLRQQYTSTGPGVASVQAAQWDYTAANEHKAVGNRMLVGRDTIAYTEGVNALTESLKIGRVSAEEYKKGIALLDGQFGESAKNTANMGRLLAGNAAKKLSRSGMDSIQFYFGELAENVSALAVAAAEASGPVSLVEGSIGRMNSASSVFKQSADAVMAGFMGMQSAGQEVLDADAAIRLQIANGTATSVQIADDKASSSQIAEAMALIEGGSKGALDARTEGSDYRAASLISMAAGIASGVMTTQAASEAAKKITETASFAGSSATQIRDVSLLMDDLKAFDATSLENTVNKLSNALAAKQISEAQYVDLFNLSISTFTDEINTTVETFGSLRDAAKSLADQLLVGDMTTLNPAAKKAEAQRQYNETLAAAQGGDKDAVSKLDSVTKNLLDIGQSTAGSYVEYTTLFGTIIADLRNLEAKGITGMNVTSNKLAIPAFASGGAYGGGLALVGEQGPEIINFDTPGFVSNASQTGSAFSAVVIELQAVREELAQLRADNNNGNAAMINASKRSAKALEKWDADGMPAVAV